MENNKILKLIKMENNKILKLNAEKLTLELEDSKIRERYKNSNSDYPPRIKEISLRRKEIDDEIDEINFPTKELNATDDDVNYILNNFMKHSGRKTKIIKMLALTSDDNLLKLHNLIDIKEDEAENLYRQRTTHKNGGYGMYSDENGGGPCHFHMSRNLIHLEKERRLL